MMMVPVLIDDDATTTTKTTTTTTMMTMMTTTDEDNVQRRITMITREIDLSKREAHSPKFYLQVWYKATDSNS